MHEFLHFFHAVVVVHEGGGQLGQGVWQVAVVIDRFDEKAQRSHVFGRQAQGQRLAVQVFGQAFLQAGALGGVERVVARLAGGGFAAPFAVVRGQVAAAVAVPVVGGGGFAVTAFAVVSAVAAGGRLAAAVAFAHGGIGARQAEFFARGGVIGALQKGVFVEHGLHFTLQIDGGQLQQADGLLQLGREGKVLRDAQ